jgi:hypothetical protein
MAQPQITAACLGGIPVLSTFGRHGIRDGERRRRELDLLHE